MKNKLAFRIIGALGSALIIASVFIPYITASGYSESLWNLYGDINSLYLPIMILVFSGISVLVFCINKKTEFAYMATGAITFFLVMKTIEIIDQNTFKNMSVGYYGLCIGTLFTGIMAFLTNLKVKKIEVKEELVPKEQETSVLEKIDNLYSEQSMEQPVVTPIQPIETVQDIQSIEPVVMPIEPVIQNQEVINQTIEPQVQQMAQPQSPQVTQVVNPVVQEFSQQMAQLQSPQVTQAVNPVVQEFSQPMEQSTQIVEQPAQVIEQTAEETPKENNPVVQDFLNPQSSTSQINPSANKGLDIFNQPLR